MIKVIGASPDRVILKDLEKDVIYYKQEKVYSDEQYKRSKDLQREIDNGRLIVTYRSKDQNYLPEDSHSISPEKIKEPEPTQVTLNSLLVKIDALEKELNERPKEGNVDTGIINQLYKKIEELESKLSNKPENSNDMILETLKKLEDKVQANPSQDIVLKKIDDLLNKAYVPSSHPMVNTGKSKESDSKDEVYVPNVTVEDSNSHINLKVRTIDNGDDLNDALKALKDLKK